MSKHHLIVERGHVKDFGDYVGTRCGLFLKPIKCDLYENKPGRRVIASEKKEHVTCGRCLQPPRTTYY